MHELTEKQLKRRENRLRVKEEKLRREEEARQQALILKQKTDEKFMKQALLQAKKAKELGEVPIGCVIVHDGKVIGRGYNRRNTDKSTLSHAEITAIRKASKKLNDWRLEDCVLYVTLEPCQMCAGAIVQARVKEVVIGAMNPKAGCAGSILNLFTMKQFNHQVQTTYGVCEAECSRILKQFFAGLRKRLHETDGSGIYEKK
ncbi:tRNA adenosine(34) deaminase TadA [Kineothrix sp. MSJ-39]|uniref:tRNA adenosine(34) deaminase TadA n=1 Tax=Kineothrix sp. MSJ-39 TaxID=2841533 RepID=UPI001C113EDF|nr:tRNA adenosine(34) deaminase TadA [Kineothrix sp. MSJ-39]MBU5429800.1 tRNA adenosine(34) deaminase TadA [Kineothrix sp. MSJ-39]